MIKIWYSEEDEVWLAESGNYMCHGDTPMQALDQLQALLSYAIIPHYEEMLDELAEKNKS